MNEAVVVPLKSFERAKERLRQNPDLDVASIAQDLARGVVTNAHPRTVIVVSEDAGVSRFAESLDAEVWFSRASNLNDAVQGAYKGLGERFERLIIVHGDLRFPQSLGTFVPRTGITFFADHRGSGTNVMVIPTGLDFHFSYGANSLHRHVEEAERLNAPYQVITTSPWRFDVDEPSDLPDA
jgi:2-phospho-L-lactate/phosphoenolpyruvate guanylyltransferase